MLKDWDIKDETSDDVLHVWLWGKNKQCVCIITACCVLGNDLSEQWYLG